MHLFGARVSRLPTENQCSLSFTLELVLPRRTPFWCLDLRLLETTMGRRRGWIFFFFSEEFCHVGPCWVSSPKLRTRGSRQCGRPGAAVKDLSLQGGPEFRIPYPLLLTSVNWDKFPDFSEPLYPQLWDENPNDKGTGLKMLPRGTVWSLFSLIPNGPKLEYYFSIFGIHIITTLGSIFLIQNSTLYDSLSLPVHQICLGGHGVGCGTGHSQQGKDSCCCVICITVTRTSMQGTHAFLNSAAVGTEGYDWRDEGFELTRGRWPGHWALQDLLAASRGIWYQKNFQKQAYSVWEGGRLFQREGQRLCKRSRSPSLKYYLLQLVPIPVELMTSSSITLGSLRLLPVPPKKKM